MRPIAQGETVFITSEGCSALLHPSKVTHKLKQWKVVTRSLEGPWYLVVYDVTCSKGRRVSQTSLVSCDEALVDLLETLDAADVRGIGRLDRRHRSGPSWNLKWIEALWKPSRGEVRKAGPLLLRFEAESGVRDAQLRPVADSPGRRLIYVAGGFEERGR